MSDGTCGAKMSENSLAACTGWKGHPGKHADPDQGVSWPQEKLCGVPNHAGALFCTAEKGHAGTGHQAMDERGVLFSWFGAPGSLPAGVAARVELHRAQTAYDLTVLQDRLSTVTISTSEASRLRRRREQLTAELDAWSYLAKTARSPR